MKEVKHHPWRRASGAPQDEGNTGNRGPSEMNNGNGTTTLYRPVGSKELELIRESNSREFPPRLPEQPIFYPVTNEEYAAQIARDWNTKNDDGLGYVTKFEVDTAYLSRFEKKIVGGRVHEEFWIPAEDLDEFNRNIVGKIEVCLEFTPADRIAAEDAAKAGK